MNILQINTNDISGGAAGVSWSLYKKFESWGHQTSMFVFNKESNDDRVFKIKRILPKYIHYLLANDLDFFFSNWIIKIKDFKEADIIHCHNLHGWYFSLSALKKISKLKPIVWTFHDEWPITAHCAHSFGDLVQNGFYQCPSRRIYPRIFWPNERYLKWRKGNVYKHTNFSIVAPSIWLYDRVKNSLLANKNIKLIPNGIDTTVFRPRGKALSRKKLILPKDKKIIMFLADGGSSNPFKGGKYLFKIKEILSKKGEVIFLCIGGDCIDSESGGIIMNIGKIRDKNLLAEYFSASDIFLLTSLAENFPLTVLEAMGCGLPVVSFDVGGVKEAVRHNNCGYLARYKDVNDLVQGIEYILNLTPEIYNIFSVNCINNVRNNFNLDLMASRYLELYYSLLSS